MFAAAAVTATAFQVRTEPQIREFTSLKVKAVNQETPNVKRVTFELPDRADKIGFQAISAVMLQADVGAAKPMAKPYNPVLNGTPGEFSVCVKRYGETARMGSAVHALQEGDSLDVKFGWRQFAYKANKYEKVGCIAGGTGLTPMLQLIEYAMETPGDKTHFTLVLANKSDEDIICKAQLDAFALKYSDRLKVVYTVEEVKGAAPWGRKGASEALCVKQLGRVTADTVKLHMPDPAEDSFKILVCGPGAMVKAMAGPKQFPKGGAPKQGPLLGLLKECGYTEKNVQKV